MGDGVQGAPCGLLAEGVEEHPRVEHRRERDGVLEGGAARLWFGVWGLGIGVQGSEFGGYS